MRFQALCYDAVLNRDVERVTPGDTKGLDAAPGYRDVVEYHVRAGRNSHAVFTAGTAFPHTNADVAHDSVVGVGKGPAVTVDGDAVAWRGLAEDTDAFGDDDTVFDGYEAANGEDDGAVGFGDGVAEGAGAAVVEVGYDVYVAVAATDGVAAEAFGTGKGKGCDSAG